MDRITTKIIEIEGRTYVIKKMDAMCGLSVARLLLAKAMPVIPVIVGGEFDIKNLTDGGKVNLMLDDTISAIGTLLESLTDEELQSLVHKCLRHCSVQLGAGLQPIIDADNLWGDELVQYNMLLTLRLCFEAIRLGASDFFGESSSALKTAIQSAFNSLSQQTMTPGSTPQ